LAAKRLGGINGTRKQPLEAKQKGGRNSRRHMFLQQNGYSGEDAFKICQDAHQGMSDMIPKHNKHMTKCPAAGCAFEARHAWKSRRHIKQVLAMEDIPW
jgi:hypothetical protein